MIELDDLDDLFDDMSFEMPTDEQLDEMRNIFERDFIENPFKIDDCDVKVVTHQTWDRDFRGEAETFFHLITRESKMKNQRQFDKWRANRIHWVKSILLQKEDARIKYYEYEDGKGVVKQHYWFEERNHLVVLKPISDDLMVVTSFVIDDFEIDKTRRRYNEYREGM
ncbi:MAG: hypothetical protein COW03_13380 [Cytophagales bacterium CG12_big_fil_rev_8_21_14_0_65_40_12]|nr:MAG: hypothetical protein COW03_13380 [Cytophagales bacterium CG12_big_fil_rev_8_21_14_0_65_40_12]PIW03126.1 MAG: hypothetical protein COW40_17455 [Cytophagales bacterium CG17_big_fil_post_rev_8_21_14_2_50_40_13]